MTYKQRINTFIAENKLKVPFTTGYFASSESIGRLSNGKTRKSKDWNAANTKPEEQVKLRTLSWVGRNLGWHVDHIVPVSRGGSYNVKNLRLLPPSLNHMIGNSGGWNHDKLNRFVQHLGPEWRKELGVPENFKSCGVMEFLKRVELTTQNFLDSELLSVSDKDYTQMSYEELDALEKRLKAELAKREALKALEIDLSSATTKDLEEEVKRRKTAQGSSKLPWLEILPVVSLPKN